MAIKLDKSEIEKKYYYEENGNTYGPFPLSILLTKINYNTLVFSEGTEWAEAKDVDELAKYFKFKNIDEKEVPASSLDADYDEFIVEKKSSSSLVLWVLIGVFAIGFIGFYIYKQSNAKTIGASTSDSLNLSEKKLTEFEIFNLGVVQNFKPTDQQKNTAASLLEDGNNSLGIKSYIEAINFYKESLMNFPQAQTYFKLSEAYLGTNDFDRSYESLQLASNLDYQPKSELDYKLISILSAKGNFEQVKNEIITLANSYPDLIYKINNDSFFYTFRSSPYFLDIIEKDVAVDSVREDSNYLNTILTYYELMNNKQMNANDFFNENVSQYINKKNITPEDVNKIIYSNSDFIDPKASVIGSRVFVSGVNSRHVWLNFKTYRNSKKKYQTCRVKVEFVFDDQNKIISLKELEVKDLLFK
jgi:tetratricopeptide (TPR) repeat protein